MPQNHISTQSSLAALQAQLKEKNSFTVVKRNGSLVPFRRDRIFKALEMAFRDTKKIEKESVLPEETITIVHEVTDAVIEQLISFASNGTCLTVEGIQDIVEVTLMKTDHHDVARDYIIYRDQHKLLRVDSPQNLKITRKDGSIVRFNPMKIAAEIEKCFKTARNFQGPSDTSIIESVNFITQQVIAKATVLSKAGNTINLDALQDEVEYQLMKEGHFSVAKNFILYRFAEGDQSQNQMEHPSAEESHQRQFITVDQGGQKIFISELQLLQRLKFACRGLENLVSADLLLQESVKNFYEEMKESEIDQANIMAAKAKIEIEPAYSTVASRLLLDTLYRETLQLPASAPDLESAHKQYFKDYLARGIEIKRLSPALLGFDLDKLAQAMQLQRDDQFTYLGLQTLYDRYFIHDQEQRLETPQIFWMRVAMGLSLEEKEEKNQRAIEFYDLLSSFYFTSGTPTLFNSGTLHSQLSSCYLSTIMDDLSHIFKVVADDAQLSKWAGGLGNDWSNVRATGAQIKGTNGKSQGIIPFLKVANDTAVAVNQCFEPSTLVYTNHGVKSIGDITTQDLVLGISGKYRQVTDKFVYNQKDPMIALTIKHSIDSLHVTAGHPFYAIQGVPMEQSIERTHQWLEKGKIKCDWVDAGNLQKGDYIAQTVPSEVVPVPNFTAEDARLYGILLADGHLTKDSYEWGVSGNPAVDTHLEFVRTYLTSKGIHYWETGRNETYMQIRWSAGKGAVRDGSTGRFVESEGASLPFNYDDIYTQTHDKWIAPRFSHLPESQTLALIQGLIETDGNISRGKEITFTNTSRSLVEGLRYQLLRLSVPTAGNFRIRKNDHTGTRSDGSLAHFTGETQCYDLRIPAVQEIADLLGCQKLTKKNWLKVGNKLFSRITKTAAAKISPIVVDLKVEDDESYMTTAGLAHNGGKRKGAMCAYLETWHLDIEDFLELRKNTGDERRRTHDMNTANWIPDLFMKRVSENGSWTLFDPSTVPDLHDLYGKAFEVRYAEYEKMTETGQIKLFKKMEAMQLWRKMLSMLFETGHPWITFKDPSNIRSPQDHVGVVHSSNLCTEILLNTSETETAVCNLGSINLPLHVTEHGLDEKKLAKTIKTAVRMLDNVIDINFYPVKEAQHANSKHRPIGLGIMGFQDALYLQDISYASHQAIEFADKSMEMVSYYAILASSELAKERGTYSSYKGSKWDRGLLPLDTIELLANERGSSLDMDRSHTMNWQKVRDSIAKHGMRNSNTLAIAPTATISNITGVSQSIEPMYKHLFVKSNLSGEFTIPNLYLVEKLKKLELWDDQMLDDLKYFDGSIAEIDRIPQEIKQLFLTAFEIDPEWTIECASRRQKWIDMGQSLNLYLVEPSGKKLHQMYFFAWTKGLKTTYYLRSIAATQIEKSTTDINKRGLQPRWMKNKSASSNVQVDREASPKSCSILDPGCESCQ
ncbi:MAG: ribonucleoside-diphosphate reductase subunit alpha [Chlamydiota bacterium]